MVFLLLISSFVACTGGLSNGLSNTIFNDSNMLIRIKKGGDDSNSQVLALKTGECVALSDAELAVLTVEEDDILFGLDDILCSNMSGKETPCESGDKVVQEAEDENGYVLADAKKSNKNCHSIHGVVAARESESAESESEQE